MRLNPILRLSIIAIFISASCGVSAQDFIPFKGQVSADNINIRSDSTVASQAICKINKGETIEVVSQLYEWYKIRLPKTAPSFIKKDLVFCPSQAADTPLPCQNATVLKDKVNIRLHPSDSSKIIGTVNKDEAIKILQNSGAWYRVEPVNNSFGWIHKNFVNKIPALEKIKESPSSEVNMKNEPEIAEQKIPKDDWICIEGIIKPYGRFFRRIATHKLITNEDMVYLLKWDKKSLNALNYHKVRVTAKPINNAGQKIPILEVEKIEVINVGQ